MNSYLLCAAYVNHMRGGTIYGANGTVSTGCTPSVRDFHCNGDVNFALRQKELASKHS